MTMPAAFPSAGQMAPKIHAEARRWSLGGRTGAASGPAAGELGLVADLRLVLPPQLYRRAARQLPADRRQTVGEALLKSSMSSGF